MRQSGRERLKTHDAQIALLFARGRIVTPPVPTPAIVTAAAFVMPAQGPLIGPPTVVPVTPAISPSLRIGSWVYVFSAGYLLVTAVGAGTITVENLGASGNASAGAVIASNSLVTATGDARDFTRLDVRRFGAAPADVGPGVAGALAAAATDHSGFLLITKLADGAQWIWATGATVNMHNLPASITLAGESTIIRVSMPVLDFVFTPFNMTESLHVQDLIFTGDPAIGNDCDAVINAGNNGIFTLTRCMFWGLQSSVNQIGLVHVGAPHSAIRDCSFIGCGNQSALGGVVVLRGGGTAKLDNNRFQDFDQFGGQGYNKTLSLCWLYIGDCIDVQVTSCAFDEGTHHQVWIHKESAIDSTTFVAQGCSFNTPQDRDQSILVDLGATSVAVEDSIFGNGGSGGHNVAADLTSVDVTTFARATFPTTISGGSIGQGTQLVISRTGNGTITFEDCVGAYRVDTSSGAPKALFETYGGKTTLDPRSLPSCVFWFDPQLGSTVNPATDVGVGATYAPVTPGHHLDIINAAGQAFSINFTGAENSQATFIAQINAQASITSISANVAGGQVELFASRFGLFFSSGSIVGTSSADVLASLGFAAGAFSPATVGALTDQSGVIDATHNLLSGAAAPVFTYANGAFNNRSTLTFTGTEELISSVWSAPLVQTYSVVMVARQVTAGTVYLLDDLTTPNRAAMFGIAAENAIHLNGGVNATFATSATTTAHVYLAEFSGATGNLAVDSPTQSAPQNVGANSLTGVRLGQIGGGGGSAGWEIAAGGIFARALTLQDRQNITAWASHRFAISLVP